MRRIAAVAVLAAILVFSLAAQAGEAVAVVRVIDGDTIEVWDGYAKRIVRLIGVDTPEAALNAKAAKDAGRWSVPVADIIQAGREARAFVISLAPPGSTVELASDQRPIDMYGRMLAYVYLPNGRCLNEVLVREGYAVVAHKWPFHERQRYLSLMDETQRQGRGYWRTLWVSIGKR